MLGDVRNVSNFGTAGILYVDKTDYLLLDILVIFSKDFQRE